MSKNNDAQIVIDDKELLKLLADLQGRVGNLRPVFEVIGEYFVGKVDDQFRDEVDPEGNPWKPLAPWTIAKKKEEGKILKILQRTGYMRSTLNYQATSQQLSAGFTDKKAREHQIGDGVPQRKLLGVTNKDKKAAVGLINEYVLEENP